MPCVGGMRRRLFFFATPGTTIERVWASDKGERGEVREANEDEEQRARARVLPVQLPPRIKRTV